GKGGPNTLVGGPGDFVAATKPHGQFVLLQQLSQRLPVTVLCALQITVGNHGVAAIKEGDAVVHGHRPQRGTNRGRAFYCTCYTLIADDPFIAGKTQQREPWFGVVNGFDEAVPASVFWAGSIGAAGPAGERKFCHAS